MLFLDSIICDYVSEIHFPKGINRWPTSVVVITFALHAKGPEFEPQVDQFFIPTNKHTH